MIPEKEKMMIFMELQSLEERGIGIWLEGRISSSRNVMETLSVNEGSTYMRDYIFKEGVLQEIHFDKITDQ